MKSITHHHNQALREVYQAIRGKKLQYHISTFGCQMNDHDSEKMAGLLETMGYTYTADETAADLILFNTCAVRENAELRVFGNIGRMKPLKAAKPELIVGVCGCMMQQDHMKHAIKDKYSYVDLVFGTHNLSALPDYVRRVLLEKERVVEIIADGSIVEGLPVVRNLDVKAFVTIMQGCDNFCSYCIVPYTRGREKSRTPEAILEEIEGLVEQGIKEVTLLGQNVNSYGKGLVPAIDFADLLHRVNAIEGLERIRFMTSHPKDLTDRLIEAMTLDKVMPTIHLPAQSGSDKILQAMNRKYTKADYLGLVDKLRQMIPDIAITSDLIIGFPGETEEDVDDTIDLIRRVEFDAAFTFIYSPRVGTPAAGLPDETSERTKHERFDRMLAVLNEIVIAKHKAREGRVFEVLIEGKQERSAAYQGRTKQDFLVTFSAKPEDIGQLRPVRITKARKFSLEGELV
ncbi:MAG TPA: tRNA (N6-isopentenyl adenosine(37)-C2)-methylthiotransferase MiaB [Tissierellia bacterium]|nr:tRNA (N6-isopentenyl adenosine(37)-C2)-methylthiotransferase MiaB [Tissierellia bacterium]